MKTGSTIQELASQLADIRDNSKDFLVPPVKLGNIKAITVEDVISETESHSELALALVNGETKTFKPSKWAHQQIREYADIPGQYYDRVRAENPRLMAQSVNHGFAMAAGLAASKIGSSGRMLRTHGGNLRAMVSTRYRRLDNFDLFEAVAPSLINLGFNVESSELTDKRLYLKCVTPKIEGEVTPGSPVQYGLVVSGSDVGAGKVRIEPLMFVLRCKNGMITQAAMAQAHLGKNLGLGDEIEDLISDRTKELTDVAFWNTVRDVVENFAKPEFFNRELDRMRAAAGMAITNFDLPEIVERTLKAVNLSVNEKVKLSIIDNLASGSHGAGMNKWGMSQAFTYGAQDDSLDYDSATDVERAGNKVIELTPRQWEFVNAR